MIFNLSCTKVSLIWAYPLKTYVRSSTPKQGWHFTQSYVWLTLMHRTQWGSLVGTRHFIKTYVFYYKSCKNLYQALQVTWSASGTASHVHYIWTCNEIEFSSDKIIFTIASYTEKISLICCHLINIVTCAVHSNRRQQTRDILHYNFVQWWYIYISRPPGKSTELSYI